MAGAGRVLESGVPMAPLHSPGRRYHEGSPTIPGNLRLDYRELGGFYPTGSKPAEFLPHFARHSNTVKENTSMLQRTSLISLLLLLVISPASAQTVLFDGLVHEDRQVAALLVPAVVTGDDYSALGRLEYGVADPFRFVSNMD